MPNANYLHRDRDWTEILNADIPPLPSEDPVDKFIHTMPQEAIDEILKGEDRRRQYRAGFKYYEETDQYGRTAFQRIRVVVEVSRKTFVELRKGDEIGECKCEMPEMFPEEHPWPDNPDVMYCHTCKKLTPRRH